jgi:hypothetical protein
MMDKGQTAIPEKGTGKRLRLLRGTGINTKIFTRLSLICVAIFAGFLRTTTSAVATMCTSHGGFRIPGKKHRNQFNRDKRKG